MVRDAAAASQPPQTSTLVLLIAQPPHRLTSMCNALDRRCSKTTSVAVESRNFPDHLHTVRAHVLHSPDSDIFLHTSQQIWVKKIEEKRAGNRFHIFGNRWRFQK